LREVRAGPGGASAAAFDPAGELLVTGTSRGRVAVWDASSGRLLTELPGHSSRVYALSVSPDGKRVASAGADGTARVWDLRSGRSISVFRGHDKQVYGVDFSPDGRLVVSGGLDGTARAWSADGAKPGLTLSSGTDQAGKGIDVNSVVFSPDGRRILT